MGCSPPFPLSLSTVIQWCFDLHGIPEHCYSASLKYFIYFNLVRYPSYMWKFVSSVLRLGETLRSALQSGDMVSVICFRA